MRVSVRVRVRVRLRLRLGRRLVLGVRIRLRLRLRLRVKVRARHCAVPWWLARLLHTAPAPRFARPLRRFRAAASEPPRAARRARRCAWPARSPGRDHSARSAMGSALRVDAACVLHALHSRSAAATGVARRAQGLRLDREAASPKSSERTEPAAPLQLSALLLLGGRLPLARRLQPAATLSAPAFSPPSALAVPRGSSRPF